MTLGRRLLAASTMGLLALSGTAQAHPRLVSATPRAGATVPAPHVIQLKFSERLIGSLTGADVVMAAMPSMPGMARRQPVKMPGFATTLGADRKTLTLLRKAVLPAGAYQVIWHAVSVDTHRVAGSFVFSVKG